MRCIIGLLNYRSVDRGVGPYLTRGGQKKRFEDTLKGVLHLVHQTAPKLACFVLCLKNFNIVLKNNICILYSKLSKELKNSIKIKVDQAVLELLIQTQHFDCFHL